MEIGQGEETSLGKDLNMRPPNNIFLGLTPGTFEALQRPAWAENLSVPPMSTGTEGSWQGHCGTNS